MKKHCLLLLTCALMLQGFLAAQTLIPYTDGEKWGYCDPQMRLLIEMKFRSCKPFNTYGLAMVEEDADQFSIIDKSGKKLLSLGKVVELVQLTDKVVVYRTEYATKDAYRLGLIREGRVSGDSYGFIGEFSGGVAAVYLHDNHGYINESGELWLMGKFDNTSSFSEGLAVVKQGKQFGYINREGTPVIPCQFDYAGDFHEGRALVQTGGKTGYINKTGALVVPCKYDDTPYSMEYFKDGAAVVVMGKKFGTVDSLGRTVIPLDYESLSYAGKGIYVAKKNGEKILLDRTGKIWMKPDFKYIFNFHNGWMQVEKDGLVNFMNRQGRLLLPVCQGFQVVQEFNLGYALCTFNNQSKFYLDTTGTVWSSKTVLPFQQVPAKNLHRIAGAGMLANFNGSLVVRKAGRIIVFDEKGNSLLPGAYQSCELSQDKSTLTLTDAKGARTSFTGKIIPAGADERRLRQADQFMDLEAWFQSFRDTVPGKRKTKSIAIGDQVWAAEDLKVGRFRNGDSIYVALWPADFIEASLKKRPAVYLFYPDNNTKDRKAASWIYNRYALTDKRGLIPNGYRLPDTLDWKELVQTAYGDSLAPGMLMRMGFANLGHFLVVDGEGGPNTGSLINTWWNAESAQPGYSLTTMTSAAVGGFVRYNAVANEYGVPVRCIKSPSKVKKAPAAGTPVRKK